MFLTFLVSHLQVVVGTDQLVIGPLGLVDDHDAVARVLEQQARRGRGHPGQRLEPGPVALLLDGVQDLSKPSNGTPFVGGAPATLLQVADHAADRVVGGRALHRGADQHAIERSRGTLVVGVERAQRLDRVAEQLDAHRLLGGRREDVDDAAAPRDLAGGTDRVHPPVAEAHRAEHERIRCQRIAGRDRAGALPPFGRRGHEAQQRPCGDQQQIQLSGQKPSQRHDALTHDLGMRGDAIVGIGVHRGQRHNGVRLATEELRERGKIATPGFHRGVVGDDQHHSATDACCQERQHEGARALDQAVETKALLSSSQSGLELGEELGGEDGTPGAVRRRSHRWRGIKPAPWPSAGCTAPVGTANERAPRPATCSRGRGAG